jgi:uncharacterized membrane-anchored protein YjiN (DUF445 family)
LVLRKGDVALIASVLLYAVGWVVYLNFNAHAGEVIRMAGEASLVGGLCDYIALKMLFERKWYLPNSGVLPRNRERIIQGIGKTVENEWLTPEMIHRVRRGADAAARRLAQAAGGGATPRGRVAQAARGRAVVQDGGATVD